MSQRSVIALVNPQAGRARLLPAAWPDLAQMLAARGCVLRMEYTLPSRVEAVAQARRAAESSALVLACGGDGTVHAVAEGLAGTHTAMGIVPLGTANALARNLRLPLDPVDGLRLQLEWASRRFFLGEATTRDGTRCFAVMAGCGPDGLLATTLPPELKRRLGRAAYYTHAARLLLTRRWPPFLVRWRSGAGNWQESQAVSLLVSRVPDLGGLFSGLTRHVRLGEPALQASILRGPAHVSLPAWFASAHLRIPNPYMTQVTADEIDVQPLSGSSVPAAQVDAEPAGVIPLLLQRSRRVVQLLQPPR